MASSSIIITPERQEQLQSLAERLLSAFNTSTADPSALHGMCRNDIEWSDHAFHITRKGHAAVLGLHRAFLHCNQPFEAEEKALHPTPQGMVLEQIWRGTCVNDIVRPDGEVAVKASGKSFTCHVCMVMGVDEEGKIYRIDEYYNKRWDEGVAVEKYALVEGESLKL